VEELLDALGRMLHYVAHGKNVPPFLIGYSHGMGGRMNPACRTQAEASAPALRDAGIEAEILDASDRSHGEINRRFGWRSPSASDSLTARGRAKLR
jgi:acetyl esterase/lipase